MSIKEIKEKEIKESKESKESDITKIEDVTERADREERAEMEILNSDELIARMKEKKGASMSLAEALTRGLVVSTSDLDKMIDKAIRAHTRKNTKENNRIKIADVKRNTRLTDGDFISQLFLWAVPPKYYGIFRDEDVKLGRKAIWQTIRDKGGSIK